MTISATSVKGTTVGTLSFKKISGTNKVKTKLTPAVANNHFFQAYKSEHAQIQRENKGMHIRVAKEIVCNGKSLLSQRITKFS